MAWLYAYLALGFLYCAWDTWSNGTIASRVARVLNKLGLNGPWPAFVANVTYSLTSIVLWPLSVFSIINRKR